MGFYRDLDPQRYKDIHEGLIIRIEGQNYVITNRKNEELLVLVTPKTKLPQGNDFQIGERIVVMGRRAGSQIEAWGISPFDGHFPKIPH